MCAESKERKLCCPSEHAKEALSQNTQVCSRQPSPSSLDNVLYGARRRARQGASIVAWHVVLGRVRKAGWNVFISGSAVTRAEEQALKASTKAIKERSATNFRASATILLTRNIESREEPFNCNRLRNALTFNKRFISR
jgi:hypothetical protein